MLNKILTVLLLALVGVILWMGITHRVELGKKQKLITAAEAARDDALEAKGKATARAETAEGINRSNAGQLATLSADLLLQKEVTRQAEERADGIKSNFDQLNSRYQEALQNDPKTRDWASTPLPDAVSAGGLLYRATAEAGDGDVDGSGGAGGATPAATSVRSEAGQAAGKR